MIRSKRNTAKTNREYQLLGEQIDADKMAIKVLEDEILNLSSELMKLTVTSRLPPRTPKVSEELETLKVRLKRRRHTEEEVAPIVESTRRSRTRPADETEEIYQRVVSIKVKMAVSEGDAVEVAINNLLEKCYRNSWWASQCAEVAAAYSTSPK